MKERYNAGAYRSVNLVLLGLAAGGLVWPVLSLPLSRFVPGLWVCPYLALFGRPCPLCGLTRGIAAVMRGDIESASACNPLTVWIFVFLVVELAFRSVVLILYGGPRVHRILRTVRLRRDLPQVVMRLDFLAHATLIGCYLCYAAAFLVIGL